MDQYIKEKINITKINIKIIKKKKREKGKNSEIIDKKNISHERIDWNKLNEITYTPAGVYQQVKDRYYRVSAFILQKQRMFNFPPTRLLLYLCVNVFPSVKYHF